MVIRSIFSICRRLLFSRDLVRLPERSALLWLILPTLILGLATGCRQAASAASVKLRLSVALTPQELASFQSALQALDQAHPEWELSLEAVPQSGFVEKINMQLASGELPDVIRIPGLNAQGWIRRDSFIPLDAYIKANQLDLTDFFPGPLEQFRWQDQLWGLPDTAAPDVVFFNKEMFDAAGLPYPNDDWTYEDMRRAAIALTRDAQGRSPSDPGFDPQNIVQWGWNGGLTYFWQRHRVRPFGGEFCANPDCTLMNFTAPQTVAAAQWWADLTSREYATLFDPYGGSQTGVPGDPFISGDAAMGFNGFFAVGQLNEAGVIQYDIVQPFQAPDGRRYTPLSTNGYLISATSPHPQEAWELVLALLQPKFLQETWGAPGHSVPARRSAAAAVINLDHPPANQQAILAAMEYGEVFKPYTASAFQAYAQTADLFQKMMKGEIPVAEAMAEIETQANTALAADREP